jgi:hypothetical protein
MVVMQADFTDQPEHLPELVKRFEGGADIVIAERTALNEPAEVKRMRQLAPWALKFFLPISGIGDPYGSFRLYRISLLRELLKSSGDKPIVTAAGWAANVELLMATVPLARRVEKVSVDPRYDLRVRSTRIRPFSDSMALFQFGRSVRGRKVTVPALSVSSAAGPVAGSEAAPVTRGGASP